MWTQIGAVSSEYTYPPDLLELYLEYAMKCLFRKYEIPVKEVSRSFAT
jgi:hypothetical protein